MEAAFDWTSVIEGPERDAFLQALRALPLERLRSQPAPKRSGLPIGEEWQVLRRHLSGGNCQLHQSALASLYRRRLDARERDAFDAFALGDPLPESRWQAVLGRETFDHWRSLELFDAAEAGLAVRFRVVRLGALRLVVDPMNVRFARRVHMGMDSVKSIEFVEKQRLRGSTRALDVGPGSGVILLHLATVKRYDEMLGVDINPRAVAVSRFNASLNGIDACRFEEQDIFAEGEIGPCDLITWNTPLRFMPPELAADNLDGFGGEMGIEIGLRFVERLPDLLSETGDAYLKVLGPVMRDGRHLLDEELRERCGRLGLDVHVSILQRMFDPKLREFHARHGIRHFENSFLRLSRGSGKFTRSEAGLGVRATDAMRGAVHALRGSGLLKTPEPLRR